MKIDGIFGDRCFSNRRIEDIYVKCVLEKIKEISKRKEEKVRVLDLATGANYLNADIARRLCDEGIDFELVLSDIAPDWMRHGVGHIERVLSMEEQQQIKCVLLDVTNLPNEVTEARYDDREKGVERLEKVLERPEYKFLRTGYEGTERIISFERESFDLVIGKYPYCSSCWMPQVPDIIDTVLNLITQNGYHIIMERQTARVNQRRARTNQEIVWGTRKIADTIETTLDIKARAVIKGRGYLRCQLEDDSYGYIKNGDIILDRVLGYQKR